MPYFEYVASEENEVDGGTRTDDECKLDKLFAILGAQRVDLHWFPQGMPDFQLLLKQHNLA